MWEGVTVLVAFMADYSELHMYSVVLLLPFSKRLAGQCVLYIRRSYICCIIGTFDNRSHYSRNSIYHFETVTIKLCSTECSIMLYTMHQGISVSISISDRAIKLPRLKDAR